jgi:hypothetical protein
MWKIIALLGRLEGDDDDDDNDNNNNNKYAQWNEKILQRIRCE